MYTIREMTASDTSALARLDSECFSVPWSEKSFSDEAENELARYFVAVSDGETVGYAGYWQVGGEGDITNIAVAKKMRRQGIASALLQRLIACAREESVSLLTLEVRRGNAAARSLYAGFGFEEAGERRNYYINPREDALIMTLKLGET